MENFKKIIQACFIFTSFFPYICVGKCFDSDLQPYSLIFAFLMIATKQFRFDLKILPIFIFFLLANILVLGRADTYIELRSVVGYLSLFINSSVFLYLLVECKNSLKFNALLYLFIWIFFGFLEQLTYKDLLVPLLSNMRTDISRGVTSLGPEPSQFGIMVVFTGYFASRMFSIRKSQMIIFLSFVSAFLLSRSAVVVGVGSFVLLIAYLNKKSIVPFVGIGISCFSLLFTLSNTNVSNNRFLILFKNIAAHPSELLERDYSVNDRIGNIYGALKAYQESGGVPNYFLSWKSFVNNNLFQYKIFSENPFFTKDIVLSTLGGITFQMGVLGLLYILYLVIVISTSREFTTKASVGRVYAIFFVGLTLIPVSLNTPILGAILASFLVGSEIKGLKFTKLD
jgi:hypothetical protein